MDIKYIILLSSLGMYYFVHSLFLHPPVKRFFIEKLFFTYRAYRIVFNIFASLGLIFIYSFSNTINSPVWIDYYLLKIVGIVVMMLGILITYKSFKNYDIKEFIGLTSESTDTLQNDLVVDGYHRFVRHPVYFATIIILVGYFIYAPSWITTIYLSVTFFYLQIGILLEENKLIFKFGKSYVDYKKVVPKLFPWFCK